MAITKDDFRKVWASTSPLTPYAFSDAHYKEGWNFIGSTPPSRQMWDFLQKNNDEKMQYLLNHFDNYLPLSGGTLTGVVNGVTPTAGDNSTKIATTKFVNAKAGNYLPLAGGNITGSLTVSGKDVERVNASGSNYIRYESGIQICWGSSADFNATGEKTVTFPAAFTSYSSYRLAVGRDWVMSWNENYYVKEKTTTSFTIVVTGTASTNNHFYSYVAVGYWK